MSLVHIETNNPVIRVFPVRNNRSVLEWWDDAAEIQ